MSEDLRFPKTREIASRVRDELSSQETRQLLALKEDVLDLVVTLVKRAYRAAIRDCL